MYFLLSNANSCAGLLCLHHGHSWVHQRALFPPDIAPVWFTVRLSDHISAGKSKFHCLLSHCYSLTSWNQHCSGTKGFPRLVISFYGYLSCFVSFVAFKSQLYKTLSILYFPTFLSCYPLKSTGTTCHRMQKKQKVISHILVLFRLKCFRGLKR